MRRLGRDFYARNTLDVARDLLGCLLVHRAPRRAPAGRSATACDERVGRIVEVEAYVGEDDRACHASRGRTRRTEVLFGPPGHAYVYLVYGMHHLLNAVTEPAGRPAAVLIRALEPVWGVAGSTRGPGLLTRAMGIDMAHNRVDLTGDRLFVVEGEAPARISRGPRVGVDYAGVWARKPWRFFVTGHPAVSGRRRSAILRRP